MKTAHQNFENWAIARFTDIKLIEEEGTSRSVLYSRYSALENGEPKMIYRAQIDNNIRVNVEGDTIEYNFQDDSAETVVLELEKKVDLLIDVVNKLLEAQYERRNQI